MGTRQVAAHKWSITALQPCRILSAALSLLTTTAKIVLACTTVIAVVLCGVWLVYLLASLLSRYGLFGVLLSDHARHIGSVCLFGFRPGDFGLSRRGDSAFDFRTNSLAPECRRNPQFVDRIHQHREVMAESST